MAMRIGILELLAIVVAGFLLFGLVLVFALRRRKLQRGFPVLPPAPPEAEEPRARGH
jgi:hypothetical protein